jgi:hypothetical protein
LLSIIANLSYIYFIIHVTKKVGDKRKSKFSSEEMKSDFPHKDVISQAEES